MSDRRTFMTGEEKAFLKELVSQKNDVVECKKTDAISASKKKKAWIEIATEFNATSENSSRTVEQLRKCWENMKSRRRKELSAEKVSRMATGGGSYKPPTEDTIDKILDTTLDIEIEGTIDSDTVTMVTASTKSVTDHNYYISDEILMPLNTDIYGEDDETPAESMPGPSQINTPRQTPSQRKIYMSRGTAIERELEVRLKRTEALTEMDKELHLLQVREKKLKIEEQEIRLAIAKEILKQEKLKTENLLKDKNNM